MPARSGKQYLQANACGMSPRIRALDEGRSPLRTFTICNLTQGCPMR